MAVDSQCRDTCKVVAVSQGVSHGAYHLSKVDTRQECGCASPAKLEIILATLRAPEGSKRGIPGEGKWQGRTSLSQKGKDTDMCHSVNGSC